MKDDKILKSDKDKGRHLNFHDWILTREIRMLDQAYDEQIYILSTHMLKCSSLADSDEREKLYQTLAEKRDRMRSMYIWRRNSLKDQFSGNAANNKGRYPWGPKKQTIEETTSDIRHGGVCYVDTDEIKSLAKDSLNGRFGLGVSVDETSEAFKDDPIVKAVMDEDNMSKKPETNFIFNDHSDLKNVPGVTMNDIIDILSEQEEP